MYGVVKGKDSQGDIFIEGADGCEAFAPKLRVPDIDGHLCVFVGDEVEYESQPNPKRKDQNYARSVRVISARQMLQVMGTVAKWKTTFGHATLDCGCLVFLRFSQMRAFPQVIQKYMKKGARIVCDLETDVNRHSGLPMLAGINIDILKPEGFEGDVHESGEVH